MRKTFVSSLLILPLVLSVTSMVSHAQTETSPSGYSIRFDATVQPTGKERKLVYREERWVSSSGAWRSEIAHSNGKIVQRFGKPDDGIFEIDEEQKKLIRLGGFAKRRSASGQGSSAGLIRQELVLGLLTNVFEVKHGEITLEIYRATQLGGDVIKLVRVSPSSIFILEAKDILLQQPSSSKLSMPQYPVISRAK